MNSESDSPPQVGARRWWPWLGLLLVVALATAVRLRLAAAPLERDEGEYAYNAQLLLRHAPPYRYAYNMKFPGVYEMYALIMAALGQTPAAIRAGVAIVNAVDTLLVFLLARRLWGARAAVPAAATFAMLSLDERSLGWVGHAEHFMLLPALGGLLILLPRRRSPDSRGLGAMRCGLAGILLGVAILMKQPAAAFAVAGAGMVAWMGADSTRARARRRGVALRLAVFAAAAAAPLAILGILLWRAGVFGPFWFWTVDYARFYASQMPLRAVPLVLGYTLADLARGTWPLWCLAVVGLAVAWLRPGSVRRRSAMLMTIILAGSLAATSAGFLFRNHYFLLLMPSAALAVGALFAGGETAPAGTGPRAAMLSFLIAAIYFGVAERRFLVVMTPLEAGHDMYGSEAFAEAVDVGKYLRSHTVPSDTICVMGSEPEIYFYARRRSATGYIYTYPLLEPQPYALAMQQQMAQEIEAARPAYVVWVHVDNSWTQAQDVAPPEFIFQWWLAYGQRYELVAVEDLSLPAGQRRLDEQLGPAAERRVGSGKALLIYRRRTG